MTDPTPEPALEPTFEPVSPFTFEDDTPPPAIPEQIPIPPIGPPAWFTGLRPTESSSFTRALELAAENGDPIPEGEPS